MPVWSGVRNEALNPSGRQGSALKGGTQLHSRIVRSVQAIGMGSFDLSPASPSGVFLREALVERIKPEGSKERGQRVEN